MNKHKFNYNWTLKDANFTKDKGKVFSCFSCGGGSTMGYKLAGFDVIGNLEIEKRKNDAYVENNHPKYNFCDDIRKFRLREDLPAELYQLDVLDGSPPCLAFSACGDREKVWGKERKRGSIVQQWDDLFFEFIELANKLQPKVVIAENVKGIIMGDAKRYVINIHEKFEEYGYYCQHFLLKSSNMGVPQRRERVFFVCLRKDLINKDIQMTGDLFSSYPLINMDFHEEEIPYQDIENNENAEYFTPKLKEVWDMRRDGDSLMCDAYEAKYGKRKYFNYCFVYKNRACPTLTAHKESTVSFYEPRYLSQRETCLASSFPLDYDFLNNSYHELCGRSVPPVMMAQISSRVYKYWLSKINK